jgi:5-methylcytosine-specific restriction protein A
MLKRYRAVDIIRVWKAADLASISVCLIGPAIDDPALSDAQFEAHHLIPLAAAVERKTHLRDMALVCVNCHRLIHRLIIQQRQWLTLDQCAALLPERRRSFV